MSDVNITNNIPFFRDALDEAKARVLEIIGGKAERYAKGKITEVRAVDTGRLRNSITHTVEDDAAIISTNVEYAPYVELGTGRHYTPPPEGMQNYAERGKVIGRASSSRAPDSIFIQGCGVIIQRSMERMCLP